MLAYELPASGMGTGAAGFSGMSKIDHNVIAAVLTALYLPQQPVLRLFNLDNSLRFVILIAAVCGLGAGRSNDAHIWTSFPILNADFPVYMRTMGLYSLRSINSRIHSGAI